MARSAAQTERAAEAPSVVAAYAGSAELGADLTPALEALRDANGARAAWLLWPCDVSCPKAVEALCTGRIDYPAGGARPQDGCMAVAERAVTRLATLRTCTAVVFTQPGVEPYTAGYLCYLAGIARRIGFSGEFGGGVLSEAFPPSGRGGAGRHLALLAAAGIALAADIGDGADGGAMRRRSCGR